MLLPKEYKSMMKKVKRRERKKMKKTEHYIHLYLQTPGKKVLNKRSDLYIPSILLNYKCPFLLASIMHKVLQSAELGSLHGNQGEKL